MDAREERLAALTGLRFFAASGILLFHFGRPLVAGGPAWAGRAVDGGYVWVSLFYVLSGFVLARAHPAPMSATERRRFWVTRFARLYPGYLVGFVLAAPYALQRWWGGGVHDAWKALVVGLATLLLVQAWLTPIARLWNATGWSLSVVAAFYAVFPFAAARLSRLSRRALWLVLAGSWAASLSLPLLYLAVQPDGQGAVLLPHEPFWLELLKFHPLPRMGEFFAGAALGLLHRRGLRVGRAGPLAGVAGLAAVVALVAWGGAPYVLVHDGLAVPLFAVAILGLAEGRGALARAFASPLAQTLGNASFALYAIEEPLWSLARGAAGLSSVPASAAYAVAFCVVAVALSVAIARWVETPARRALRARLGVRAGARAPERARA